MPSKNTRLSGPKPAPEMVTVPSPFAVTALTTGGPFCTRLTASGSTLISLPKFNTRWRGPTPINDARPNDICSAGPLELVNIAKFALPTPISIADCGAGSAGVPDVVCATTNAAGCVSSMNAGVTYTKFGCDAENGYARFTGSR